MFSSIPEMVRSAAEKYGEKTAYTDTEKNLSFQEVDRLSEKIAAAIAERGLFRKPIFVLTGRDVYTPVVFLGIARAGCFYIPVDVSQNPYRIRQILETVQPELVIAVGSETARTFDLGFSGPVLSAEEILRGTTDSIRPADMEPELSGELPLYVIFTSGSTGRPKGVVTSVGSVLNYIDAVDDVLKLTPDDVLGSMTSLDYIAAIRDIYLPLQTGAMTVFLPGRTYAMAHDLAGLMEEYRISVLCWSAAAMELCVRIGLFEELKAKYIREVIFSGSVLPGKVLKKWQSFFPKAVFINQYGPTETTASCTYYVVKDLADVTTVLPVGKPYKNYGIILLDEEGHEAGPGAIGEICVSGAGVALGYYHDEEQSAAAFVQNPLNQECREIIYKTGDLGRFNREGLLEFLGRKDRQIKFMGHRVEPEEIEQCARSIEGVEECAVVYDAGSSRLCMFYAGSADKKKLFFALREKLPAYMVPGRITASDQLPKLANGKTDLKAISKLAARRQ